MGAIMLASKISLAHEPRLDSGRTFRFGDSRILNCVAPHNTLISSHDLSAEEIHACHALMHMPGLSSLVVPTASAAWHRKVSTHSADWVGPAIRRHEFFLRWLWIAPSIAFGNFMNRGKDRHTK